MEGLLMKKALFVISLLVTFNVTYGMDGGDDSGSWVVVEADGASGSKGKTFTPRAEALLKQGTNPRLIYQDEQGKLKRADNPAVVMAAVKRKYSPQKVEFVVEENGMLKTVKFDDGGAHQEVRISHDGTVYSTGAYSGVEDGAFLFSNKPEAIFTQAELAAMWAKSDLGGVLVEHQS